MNLMDLLKIACRHFNMKNACFHFGFNNSLPCRSEVKYWDLSFYMLCSLLAVEDVLFHLSSDFCFVTFPLSERVLIIFIVFKINI